MAHLISLSIDVSKIDKSKLIKGEKGIYLNLNLSVNDSKDQFGNDVSAWHGQSKEERDAGQQKVYLGNGRVLWTGTQQPQGEHLKEEDLDNLPF